jgi:hypothetical protein
MDAERMGEDYSGLGKFVSDAAALVNVFIEAPPMQAGTRGFSGPRLLRDESGRQAPSS